MRGGVLATGIVLFVFGIAMVLFGSMATGSADACRAIAGCQGGEAARTVGMGFYSAGALIILGGIALSIAGVVLPDKTRQLTPIAPAPAAAMAMRACPSCAKGIALDASFCAHCGAAVAPVRRPE